MHVTKKGKRGLLHGGVQCFDMSEWKETFAANIGSLSFDKKKKIGSFVVK